MPVSIKFASPFRRHTGGTESVTTNVTSLPELFADLEQRFPGLTKHLVNESGDPRPFLNIYVNDEDIRFLGGKSYRFAENDEILLLPSVAGG